MTEENFEDNLSWKTFVELRRQVQCSAAAGMSETEVDAEIATYRSRKALTRETPIFSFFVIAQIYYQV